MKKVAKEVIDFVTFLTIYRGAWISKSNSGARVAREWLIDGFVGSGDQ